MLLRCSVHVIILVFCVYEMLAQFGTDGEIWEDEAAAVNPGGGACPRSRGLFFLVSYRWCACVCVCVCVFTGVLWVHWWLSGIHSELPIERLVVQGPASGNLVLSFSLSSSDCSDHLAPPHQLTQL